MTVIGLGIGLAMFMFAIIYGVFLRGLNVPDAHQILVLSRADATVPGSFDPQWSYADTVDLRRNQRTLNQVSTYRTTQVVVGLAENASRHTAALIAANLWEVLQVPPMAGREFSDDDAQIGVEPVVILAEWFARERFGEPRLALGEVIRIDGAETRVVGVMPPEFRFPENQDLWLPLIEEPVVGLRERGGAFSVLGRSLEDDTSAVRQDVAAVLARWQDEHPETYDGVSVGVETFIESQTGGELSQLFLAMVVAVTFVLVIATANVANLMMTRAATRTVQVATRAALGGGTFRAAFPFLAEALLISLGGAAIGLGVGWAAVDGFDRATSATLTGRPSYIQFEIGIESWLFSAGLAFVCTVLVGLTPVMQLRRLSPAVLMRDDSRGSSSLRVGRVMRSLVVVEVALSCALLVGSGLTARSILALSSYEYPFATEPLLAADIDLAAAKFDAEGERARIYGELSRLGAEHPSIAAGGLTTALPATFAPFSDIALENDGDLLRRDQRQVHTASVGTGFFAALGVEPIDGRLFRRSDEAGQRRVAIVNISLQQSAFDGESAVGRRIRLGSGAEATWVDVVGVVPDLAMAGFATPGTPDGDPSGAYLSLAQEEPEAATFLMSVAGETESATAALRAVLTGIDPDVAPLDVRSFDEVIRRNSWFYRAFGTVFVIFGVAALFIAATGLYGIVSFGVARRRQEIGVRVALGAQPSGVLRLVARQAGGQLALGLCAGLVLAWMVSRVIVNLMFNVDPRDPLVFVSVIGALGAVGVFASLEPAWRALRVDAVEALRAR